jgi:hypothetical protein
LQRRSGDDPPVSIEADEFSLSPREFFPQFIAVGQDGVAPALAFRKRIFEGLKLPFFRLADRKRLVDCHIAVDHRRTLGGE